MIIILTRKGFVRSIFFSDLAQLFVYTFLFGFLGATVPDLLNIIL